MKKTPNVQRPTSNVEVRGRRSRFRRRTLLLGLCVSVYTGDPISATEPQNARSEKEASGHLDVGGAKIYYEERGAGGAIVLLHDGLLHSVSWDEVWQPLADKYHVIRYDRRGYGRSEPATASFSPTEDLGKLLRHLKVEHAVIVGSSSGGALAIDFAIAHPEMVDGLFLIGPILHGMDFSTEFRERANRNNAPMERDDAPAMARNWSQDNLLIFGANEKARRKIYEQLVANAEKLKKYDPGLEAKLSPPASERLSEIKAPTAILVGEGDTADVHAHSAAINAGVARSERMVAKGAGHLIQLERPDEVVNWIEDFVARRARR